MGKKISTQDFQEKVNLLTDEYLVLGNYISSSEKILIKHLFCGNEYYVSPNNFLKGRRCPYCAGRKPSETNNLLAQNATIAKEFDEDKNGIKVENIIAHSNKKYWWRCAKGHAWEASPNSRMGGTGCPICSRIKNSRHSNDIYDKIDVVIQRENLVGYPMYRIDECRGRRAIPFSLGVFQNDNLIGLIDWKNKYYPQELREQKVNFCRRKHISYLYLTKEDDTLNNQQLKRITNWLAKIKDIKEGKN